MEIVKIIDKSYPVDKNDTLESLINRVDVSFSERIKKDKTKKTILFAYGRKEEIELNDSNLKKKLKDVMKFSFAYGLKNIKISDDVGQILLIELLKNLKKIYEHDPTVEIIISGFSAPIVDDIEKNLLQQFQYKQYNKDANTTIYVSIDKAYNSDLRHNVYNYLKFEKTVINDKIVEYSNNGKIELSDNEIFSHETKIKYLRRLIETGYNLKRNIIFYFVDCMLTQDLNKILKDNDIVDMSLAKSNIIHCSFTGDLETNIY